MTPMAENLEQDEEGASYQRFLNRVLLIALLACLLTFGGVLLTGNLWTTRSVGIGAAIGVVVLSYWQMQRSLRRGTVVLVVGWWVAVSAMTIAYAGVHSGNLLVYAFLIALSGWILGRAWLIGVTVATVGLITGLGVLEFFGLFQPSPRAGVGIVGSVIVGALIVLSFLTAVAHRALSHGRDRAVSLAKDLAVQNLALSRRERDLQMVMEHVPAAIASFDARSKLRFGNVHYAALFGVTPDQLVGLHIADYVPKDALDFLMPHWNKCLEGAQQSYRRFNRNPVTGIVRIIDVQIEPEFDNGRVTGLFALMIDATDKVAAEDHIRDLNETLEKRVAQRTLELEAATDRLQRAQEELARSETKAALSTMIASVSHELSTPLGNGLMTASTLLDQGNAFQKMLDSNQIKRSELLAFVDTVRQGNDLLLRNLHRATDLLGNFRQVASDHASEQRRVFDLSDTVGEIVNTLAPSLKRHPHKMVLTIAAGIQMDSLPGALGQVVINLINNAYLHAFEGRNDGLLTINATRSEDALVLQFIDNGVGMSPENLERLFEPFFSTKKGRGGTGLGMSIVENLVRKTLGGTLTVQSELGVGTCFEVCMPLVAPRAEQQMPAIGADLSAPA